MLRQVTLVIISLALSSVHPIRRHVAKLEESALKTNIFCSGRIFLQMVGTPSHSFSEPFDYSFSCHFRSERTHIHLKP